MGVGDIVGWRKKEGLKKGWEEKGDFVFSPLLSQDGRRSTKRNESSTRPKDQFPSLSNVQVLDSSGVQKSQSIGEIWTR